MALHFINYEYFYYQNTMNYQGLLLPLILQILHNQIKILISFNYIIHSQILYHFV